MKGFIFTIETIITVLILLVTLTILGTYFIDTQANNQKIIDSQVNTINSFYFNDFETNNENIETKYCNKIIIYENEELIEKYVCEGY